MTDKTVARRYAKALFAIGEEQGKTEVFAENIKELKQLVEENEEVRHLLENQSIESLPKKNAMKAILADADDLVKNFICLVIDKDRGAFFADNDERAIFFARGVLETVKKLRWAPDIIHCQGWISQLVPVYLKKAYRDDPIFSESRIVLSLYDDTPSGKFSDNFAAKARFGSVSAEDLALLEGRADGINLAQTAARYSDGIIYGSGNVDGRIRDFCTGLGLPTLEYDEASYEDGGYIDEYCGFYDRL